ncbi:hypothetical protein T439DRAFT_320893 [Meredithblackwellia eburnea MCA 4105]
MLNLRSSTSHQSKASASASASAPGHHHHHHHHHYAQLPSPPAMSPKRTAANNNNKLNLSQLAQAAAATETPTATIPPSPPSHMNQDQQHTNHKLPLSPTLSTLSSLSSSSPDLGLLSHPYSPDNNSTTNKRRRQQHTASDVNLHSAPASRSRSAASALDAAVNAAAANLASPANSPAKKPVRKERQTRIQEHLKSVKPGSPSPSVGSNKSASTNNNQPPKHQQLKQQHSSPSPIPKASAASSTSANQASAIPPPPPTLSLGAPFEPTTSSRKSPTRNDDVDFDAIVTREKNELVHKLASHGINPLPVVLDQVVRSILSSQDGPVTVQLFLHALSTLDETPATLEEGPFHDSGVSTLLTPRPSPRSIGAFAILESPFAHTPSSAPPPRMLSAPTPSSSFQTSSSPTPQPRASTEMSRNQSTASTSAQSRQPLPFAPFPSPSTSGATEKLAPSPTFIQGDRQSPPRGSNVYGIARRAATNEMVAAEVQGMGRVAFARTLLFERLGAPNAESAIAAASTSKAIIDNHQLQPSTEMHLAFGAVVPPAGPPLVELDVFGAGPRKYSPPEGELLPPVVLDHRQQLVHSWLASGFDDEDDVLGREGLRDDESTAWSAVPKEWDEDLAALDENRRARAAAAALAGHSGEEEEEDDDEVMKTNEIRVGGKSVKLLLRSKRLREEEEMEMVRTGSLDGAGGVSVATSAPELLRQSSRQQAAALKAMRASRPNPDVVGCVCDRGDEGEAMVQCDDCRIWYHLECLHIPSARKLPKQWFCFRCLGEPGPHPSQGQSSPKRAKLSHHHHQQQPPSTPILYREPTFVSATLSPRPKGNFYHNGAADVVLAPSPQSSPSRRFVPRSPAPHHQATPVTPQLGSHNPRHDYAPRSPLFFRAGRSRMLSGAFDDLPGANGQHHPHHLQQAGGWVSSWDGHNFGLEEPMAPMDDNEFWHDMTLTPSRSIQNTSYGWEAGLSTPHMTGRRNRLMSSNGPTASQDFLSGLHHYSNEDSHAHAAVAQRMLASPAYPSHHGHHHHIHHHPVNPYGPPPPMSPLARTRHARIPSAGAFSHLQSPNWRATYPVPPAHGGESFAAPPPTHSSPVRRISASRPSHYETMPSPKLYERKPAPQATIREQPQSELQQGASQADAQGSDMARSASGLGIGFGQVQLDDLISYNPPGAN